MDENLPPSSSIQVMRNRPWNSLGVLFVYGAQGALYLPSVNLAMSTGDRGRARLSAGARASCASGLLRATCSNMGDTWITAMVHFDWTDAESERIPGPAQRLAEYLGSIVAASVGPHRDARITQIQCRRRPGRKRCEGRLVSAIVPDELHGGDAIEWQCPLCGDNGLITEWEGTRWAQ